MFGEKLIKFSNYDVEIFFFHLFCIIKFSLESFFFPQAHTVEWHNQNLVLLFCYCNQFHRIPKEFHILSVLFPMWMQFLRYNFQKTPLTRVSHLNSFDFYLLRISIQKIISDRKKQIQWSGRYRRKKKIFSAMVLLVLIEYAR